MQLDVVQPFKYQDRSQLFKGIRGILTIHLETVQLLAYGSEEDKVRVFLERFPEHRKTLRLALVHEEAGEAERNYRGWQWSDVETHPTKLISLVIEGVSRVNLKTRHSTHYLLRNREAVRKALTTPGQI